MPAAGRLASPVRRSPRQPRPLCPVPARSPKKRTPPATLADATGWVHDALWLSPYVDISQARFEEWGSVHMESLDKAGAMLTAHLENGQVFTITVTESAA